jgi:parvulin-like peptidyl-prolyl isomerase
MGKAFGGGKWLWAAGLAAAAVAAGAIYWTTAKRPGPAGPPGPADRVWADGDVVIRRGAEGDLTYADMRKLLKTWARSNENLDDLGPEQKAQFFRRYYNEILLAAEARRRGLHETEEFRTRTLAARYAALVPVYKQREIVDRYRPTEEELYQYVPPAQDEVRVRVIVKEDPAEARRVYEEALAGKDFAALARDESEGFLRAEGGLTGFHSLGNAGKFPPPVVQRFLDAEVGEILPPFYQDIGFLVVKIDAKRTAEQLRRQELERRRAEIEYGIHQHYYDQRLDALFERAQVVYHDPEIDALARQEGDPAAVVLEVNGVPYRAREILGPMADAVHSGQPLRQRIERFVETALVGEEAVRLGLERDPLFAETWGLVETRELAQEVMRHELAPVEAAPITDEEVAAHAAARPEQFAEPEARHLRLILTDREDQAHEALARLRGGAPFAEVARALSVDTNTAASGGDLGFLAADDVPEPVREAAFALPAGAYTPEPLPVVSALDGTPLWVLLQVEAVRERAVGVAGSANRRRAESAILTLRRTERLKSLIEESEARLGYALCLTEQPK